MADREIRGSTGISANGLGGSGRTVASNGPFRVSFTFRISVVLDTRRIRKFGVQRGHRKAIWGVLAGFWPQAVRFGWSSRLEFRSLWTFGGSGNSGFNGDLCKRFGGLWPKPLGPPQMYVIEPPKKWIARTRKKRSTGPGKSRSVGQVWRYHFWHRKSGPQYII